MSRRFASTPPREDPRYLRPPEEAYEPSDDPDYRRHQAVNQVITRRLINRITGRGSDQETVYGIDPQEQFFAGVLASQYPYREAQAEDDAFQNIAAKVAPFTLGVQFRVDADIDPDTEVRITPTSSVYYRRFPTYEEQIEHGDLAEADEDIEIEEQTRPEAMADGGSDEATDNQGGRTQSLVGVYDRITPDFPTISLTGEQIRSAAESGATIEQKLQEPFEEARQDFEDDERAYREAAPGTSIRRQRGVAPEVRTDAQSFQEHLEEVFTGDPVPTPWQATVRLSCQNRSENGVIAITARLVNTHGEAFEEAVKCDEEWQTHLFDAGLTVETDKSVFRALESEEILDEYQYDGAIYGSGENCAVERDHDENPTELSTTAVPVYQQPKYKSRETLPAPFEKLAEGDIDTILLTIAEEMERAVEQYESVREEALAGKSEETEADFDEMLAAFAQERDRFQRGRELIRDDAQVEQAFRAMNRTFARLGEKFTEWRLFQIIFIVMMLPDIVAQADPSRDVNDRLNLADVIYFPTGGGKTEAYLGLVSFTAFYDRLRGKDFGTTAWTKFPLRLLSLQQLQRIANVLCQAETVRRESEVFGGEPFSVGYFVGKNNTPNKVVEGDDSGSNNARLAREDTEKQEDWLIVAECPFCGEESVEVTGDEERLRIIHRCTNAECPEVERQDGPTAELPVYITDEEVYRYAPTFVVSTIDKIAIMGMQRRARTLFGRIKHRCPDHGFTGENGCLCDDWNYSDDIRCDGDELESVDPVDPPSLFIQDELHLLREEFGAFDSHYETFLQEWMNEVNDGGWEPKYIAATATIEGAEEQVQSLYWRDASIFPSQGPRLKQSFYAYEDPYQLGRQMVGAIPRSVSRTFAMNAIMKEYARIIQEFRADLSDLHDALLGVDDVGPLALPDDPEERGAVLDDLLDEYEVQIAYNISKSDSDMLQRSVKTMINRQLESYGDPYQRLVPVSLTGETPMSMVRDALSRLETDDPDRPIDVVIATSMISHGVDVDKFNFISFFGMPRNTAEYIQAYSRVGRQHTGTVFVLFSSMRARDRSHYTRFDHYHRYQDLLVEATPLERWAEFAVECTLPGIFAGLVIQYYDELLEDEYDSPRVYSYEGLEEAARQGDIDREEMLKMVLRCYAVTEDHEREWADTTGMTLYREKIRDQFEELWARVMKRPLDPKKTWIGFLLDREEDHRGPMRSLRDIDEQIPIFPTQSSAKVLDMLTDN